MKEATAYIDGSGNSGRIQACATVLTVDGACYKRTRLLPPHTTNNVGEYSGLLLAIRLARELNVEALHVRSDSKLIVEQMKGNWKCKQAHLRELLECALRESQFLSRISLEWIPREDNVEADALCREVARAARQQPTNPYFRA